MPSLLTDQDIDTIMLQSENFLGALGLEITRKESYGYDVDNLYIQAYWIHSNMKVLQRDVLSDEVKFSCASALMKYAKTNKFFTGKAT